jgi:protein tyrosine phosphatase
MLQHLNWSDGTAPKNPLTLFDMVHSLKKMDPDCTVVHGSTGVGRTGTFIALWHLINQIHEQEDFLNVFKTVLNLRKDRKFMVRLLQIVFFTGI